MLAQFAGLAKAGNSADIQRATAHSALLATAVKDGFQAHTRFATAHIQRAHALGSIHLVTAPGKQINIVALNIGWHFANPLRAVAVENNFLVMAQFANGWNFIDGSNFIVGPHDGNQNCVGANFFGDHVYGDHTVGGRLQVGDIKAFLLKSLAWIKHGLVFVKCGDNVAATSLSFWFFGVHVGRALDGQVVAFGGATCENNFLGVGANQRGGLLARFLNGFLGFPTKGVVAATRISVGLGEIRKHHFHHAGIASSGSGVV